MEDQKKGLTGKDVVALVGLLLFIGGAGWVYKPLAPIFAGLFIFAYCFVTVKK